MSCSRERDAAGAHTLGHMPEFVKQLADTVTSTGVRAAYGEAVELDGSTIIPVAAVWYGFGGGAGPEGSGDRETSGGGGGGVSLPIGAYVTSGGQTRFEPNLVTLLAVGIPLVWVTGRGLARIVKAFRK